jgi:hypothetical protein
MPSDANDPTSPAYIPIGEEEAYQPTSETPSETAPRNSAHDPVRPLGLDIGTASIVVARAVDAKMTGNKADIQQNVFFSIPHSSITAQTLARKGIGFFKSHDSLYVLGNAAEEIAVSAGANLRRPIQGGLLNPSENEAVKVIMALVQKLIPKQQPHRPRLCYSVPGKPIDGDASIVYHESVLKMYLEKMGYQPQPVNEGLAVIYSALAENNYTGIGISMGGGMCNVCFAYLSIPVITYSIQLGGDYIDQMVGRSVGEPASKIKAVKERDLDLSKEPRNRIEAGLHIYYTDLFTKLAVSLRQALGSSDQIPRLSRAVPLILSGGTVKPSGARQKFIEAFSKERLPIRIADIRVAEDPLRATAKGALVMALAENEP